MSNRDKIDLNYRNILKDEFQVTLSDTATRVQVIRKLNSELNDFISNEDEKITLKRHVLFVFDNVKREEEIEEYLSDLPPKIKILITTRNKDLFHDILNLERVDLETFSVEQAKTFLKNSEHFEKLSN